MVTICRIVESGELEKLEEIEKLDKMKKLEKLEIAAPIERFQSCFQSFKAPVASLLHPFSMLTTGYISYKTYSIRKRIDLQDQEAQAKKQVEEPTAKYFPTVNKFSRSTMDLVTLYVSFLR